MTERRTGFECEFNGDHCESLTVVIYERCSHCDCDASMRLLAGHSVTTKILTGQVITELQPCHGGCQLRGVGRHDPGVGFGRCLDE